MRARGFGQAETDDSTLLPSRSEVVPRFGSRPTLTFHPLQPPHVPDDLYEIDDIPTEPCSSPLVEAARRLSAQLHDDDRDNPPANPRFDAGYAYACAQPEPAQRLLPRWIVLMIVALLSSVVVLALGEIVIRWILLP